MVTIILKSYLLVLSVVFVNAVCERKVYLTCTENRTNLRCDFPNITSFEYQLIDNDTAEYNFSLNVQVDSCKFDGYELRIMHNEDNVFSESGCNSKTQTINMDPFDKFDVNASLYSNCSKVQFNFCVPYLYQNCYLLRVKPSPRSRTLDKVFWLSNTHAKNDFIIRQPNFGYKKSKQTLEVKWQFDLSPVKLMDLSRKMEIREHHSGKHVMTVNDCFVQDLLIYCEIKNLTQGNYTLRIILLNEWNCKRDHCSWYRDVVWKYDSDAESLIRFSATTNSSQLYGGIVTGVIILLICITTIWSYFYHKKRRNRNNWQLAFENKFQNNIECQILEKESPNGIFLIYARDCDLFMSLMANFRITLEAITERKVYDIFDDTLFNEIAASPHEWVQNLIQDPRIKIVVIATECADILYKNLIKYYEQPSLTENQYSCYGKNYITPNYLDGLFLHSLKLISFDITPVPYHKYFVVRFPKFNKHDDYLCHINPFKRYDLPECLEVLRDNILEHSKTEPGEWDDNSSEKKIEYTEVNKSILLKDIDELLEYVKLNPSYITDFLLDT